MAGVDGLNPQFLSQLMAFVQASHGLVTLEGGSGFRTIAEQAQLRRDWEAGRSSAPSVARPGHSQHNFGLAFDLKFPGGDRGRQWAAANAAAFGLHFPVEGEPWHVEPVWGRDQGARNQAVYGYAGMDLGFQPVSPAQAKDMAKSLYGYLGWFVDHPEVGPILIDAAMKGWDQGRLMGRLSQTKWWKTTSESARQWDALMVSDRATANRRIQETKLSLQLEAQRLGISITNKRFLEMATNANRLGWNPDEIKLALAAEMRWDPKQVPGGQVGKLMGDVRQTAADYLVPVNDKQAWDWAKRITGGVADMGAVEQQMKLLAGVRFPSLIPQIQAGVTPDQFFTPARNQIAQLLEVAPDEVDLMSDEWLPVTSFSDPKTGQIRPMTFTELERYARSRDAWAGTQNAMDAGVQAVDVLTQIFGEMAT